MVGAIIYALGANKWQTVVKVKIPAAASGIIAACMLGMGRAIGETMTVLMATGNAPAMPQNLLSSVKTMTATIAIEANFAINEGENRVITAKANSFTRMPLGSALTDDDVSSNHCLSTKLLHAAALCV